MVQPATVGLDITKNVFTPTASKLGQKIFSREDRAAKTDSKRGHV